MPKKFESVSHMRKGNSDDRSTNSAITANYGSTDYRFLSKVYRRLLKKNERNWKFLDLTQAYDVLNHKFLELTPENMLSWKTHIDTIVCKLSSATFAIRTVKPYLSQDSIKMIYYSHFHSIMTFGIILGGKFTL